ncbi:hypothetical protein [Marinobacterium mangrovicola]|uniref:Secreted protein n=1 Tax=Marinobacterium mangrovicola TaxID=1476959 RepID=A0A4R1GFY3_9GAMM|nr:hypothetical protein [Marinobacterium mangrovicola]TCK05811.1 hypothetical protein CLV83_2744 [Marinobacterium mangrovicola]
MTRKTHLTPMLALALCALLALFASVSVEAGTKGDTGLVPPAIIVDSCITDLSLGESGDGDHSAVLPSSPLPTIPDGYRVESPAWERVPYTEIRALPPSRAPPVVF